MKTNNGPLKEPSYQELRKEVNVHLILIGLTVLTSALFFGILFLLE
jgi:hypothetical protein